MIDYIKQWIKIRIKYFIDVIKMYDKSIDIDLKQGQKYVFIFFAADYNNLGDIAITYAQEKFIKENLSKEYKIIKIVESETYQWVKAIRKLQVDDVIITLIGGGNNGSLYEFLEEPRRFILKFLRKYKIVSFPQSVFFEEEYKYKPYKKAFLKLCKKCENLTLVAREMNSYNFYKKNCYQNNCLLVPDIVFSLQTEFELFGQSDKENKVTYILRDDKEKALDLNGQLQVIDCINKKIKKQQFLDTCSIKYENDIYRLIFDYVDKLKTSKLAVTDRLHGMILCYLLKLPCIVINNNNDKIKSTFETWMLHQNYIKMYDVNSGMEELKSIINCLDNITPVQEQDLTKQFSSLKESLK